MATAIDQVISSLTFYYFSSSILLLIFINLILTIRMRVKISGHIMKKESSENLMLTGHTKGKQCTTYLMSLCKCMAGSQTCDHFTFS